MENKVLVLYEPVITFVFIDALLTRVELDENFSEYCNCVSFACIRMTKTRKKLSKVYVVVGKTFST